MRRSEPTKPAHKVYTVDRKNGLYAQTVALIRTGNVKASETNEHAMNTTITVAMALAGTGLPALCFFVAGLYRNRREDEPDPASSTLPQKDERQHGPIVVQPQQIVIRDERQPQRQSRLATLTVADLLNGARAA